MLGLKGLNKDSFFFKSFVILLINFYIYLFVTILIALSVFTEHCFLGLF